MKYHFKKPNWQRGDSNLHRRYQSTVLLSTSPADGVVVFKAVDWYRRCRFESPRCQWGFSNIPWLNIANILINNIIWAMVQSSLIFIVANIKILGIMLISQMIKGCKEKFFINQIFDENIRRLHQGKKFFGKKNCIFLPKNFFPWWRRLIFSSKVWLIKNFSLQPFIIWLFKFDIYIVSATLDHVLQLCDYLKSTSLVIRVMGKQQLRGSAMPKNPEGLSTREMLNKDGGVFSK